MKLVVVRRLVNNDELKAIVEADDRRIGKRSAQWRDYCYTMHWSAAALVASLALGLRADVNVMKDVTLGFGQALDKCRAESELTEEKMEDFFHFWREDFKFEQRELGCAIFCMSKHFNLLTDSSRMHHDKTHEFIKSFPNGEVLSQVMVELIHSCEKQHDAEEDDCWRILRVAECFKVSCQRRGLAPSMEMMMTEFIMESER